MYLINTLLGFAIAQVYDIFRRERGSEKTPKHFDIWFFLKDTYQKIILSLFLSLLISVAVHFNWEEALSVFGKDWPVNNLLYLVIGAAPEMVLQWAKKKYGFGQPETVGGYQRKTNNTKEK